MERLAHRTGTAFGTAVATLLIAMVAPVCAQDLGETIRRGLYDDTSLTVHVLSHYLDQTNPALPNNVAWAVGAWVGYETGWFFDAVRFGVGGYASQPLVTPTGADGTLHLRPGPLGYTVLGQAYGKLKLFGQEFTGFRQLINRPDQSAGQPDDVQYVRGRHARRKARRRQQFFRRLCRQDEGAQLR